MYSTAKGVSAMRATPSTKVPRAGKTLSLANAGKNPSKREGLGLRADYGNERT
jgi:hypothetical protein